jgi:pimeloyl-ACP methyl ester carboxylesterase
MSATDAFEPTSEARRRLLQLSAMLGAAGALGGCVASGAPAAADDAGDVRHDKAALAPQPLPPQAPAKSGLARLPNVQLWYWDTGGDGPAVVFLHPFTGSAFVWSYQQPVFAQAGYRVIGYSRRGYQQSEAGPADAPGTGAEDLGHLMDYLGITTFHAVGSAGGAFVAADYASSHPERLRSLVLACSILGIKDPELTTMMNALSTPGFEQMPAYFRELSPSYRAMDPAGAERWKELERNSMPGPHVAQHYVNELSLSSLSQLAMPTLLIAGDADLIAPPPLARLFARRIARSELAVIAECGHSAYWERPAQFNNAVLGFLGRQRS